MRSTSPQRPQSTYDLLLVPPADLAGLSLAYKSAENALKRMASCGCSASLLDPLGEQTGFSTDAAPLLSRLKQIVNKVPAPDVAGQWLMHAEAAIRDLSIMPGRHVIVIATSYDSPPDASMSTRGFQSVDPSQLIGRALEAHATIYTASTSGPKPVVPFGGAADSQYTAQGPALAAEITSRTEYLGALRGIVLQASAATGGTAESSIGAAFERSFKDNDGYYIITFRPQAREQDGTWHPATISVKHPYLHVRAPRYYSAPTSVLTLNLSAIIEFVGHSGNALRRD